MNFCTVCHMHPVSYRCPMDNKVGVCRGCACMLSGKYDWTWNYVGDQAVSGLISDVHLHLPNSTTDKSMGNSAVKSIVGATNTLGQNIQTVAIVGLCLGALIFLYMVHEGHKTASKAFDFAHAHPDTVAKLAML